MAENFEIVEISRNEQSIPDSKDSGIARKMTRDIWLREVFPEWHQVLNKQIEEAKLPEKSFALWMLGGPSWAYKSAGGAIILIDNYSGSSLNSKYSYCGVCRTTGSTDLSWMRINPHVLDPWAFHELDYCLITHHHQDHADIYTVAATLQTTNCKYVCPKNTVPLLKRWGVSDDRLIEVKPGDKLSTKDVNITVERNYDSMACLTGNYKPGDPLLFDENAVSFILEANGNSVIFLGDTLYSDGYKAVGGRNHIDVVVTDMGHNAPGGTDKMNPWDVLRVTQNLGAKIVIPDHYENWASSEIDPHQLSKIIDENDSSIHACIMKSGGMFVYPRDKEMREYKYPDWREKYTWEKSFVYGNVKPENR